MTSRWVPAIISIEMQITKKKKINISSFETFIKAINIIIQTDIAFEKMRT